VSGAFAAVNCGDLPAISLIDTEIRGGFDDAQPGQLEERLAYLREIEARRASILDGIRGQGKLTEDLEVKIALSLGPEGAFTTSGRVFDRLAIGAEDA